MTDSPAALLRYLRLEGALQQHISRRPDRRVEALRAAASAYRRVLKLEPGDRHVCYSLASALSYLGVALLEVEAEQAVVAAEEIDALAAPFIFPGAPAAGQFHRVLGRACLVRARAAWKRCDRPDASLQIRRCIEHLGRACDALPTPAVERELAEARALAEDWADLTEEP